MLSYFEYYDVETKQFVMLCDGSRPEFGRVDYDVDYNQLQRESLWVTVPNFRYHTVVHFSAASRQHRQDWFTLALCMPNFNEYLDAHWRWLIPLLADPAILHELAEDHTKLDGYAKHQQLIPSANVDDALISRLSFLSPIRPNMIPQASGEVMFSLGGRKA